MAVYNTAAGSSFWIILIAIFLFGALSFALIDGGRIQATSLSDDEARLAATEILSYGGTLSNAVQKLRLNGCADTALDLENPVWRFHGTTTPLYAAAHNPNAGENCGLFAVREGGAIASILPKRSFYPWDSISGTDPDFGHGLILSIILPGQGDAAKEELVYRLPFIKRAVCLKINEALKIENPSGVPPGFTTTLVASTALNRRHDGVYPEDSTLNDTNGVLSGKTAFCATHGAGDPEKDSFFQVLIVR